MKIDLREKIKSEKMQRELPKNHRELFAAKLDEELHREQRNPIRLLMIAASVAVLFGLGYFAALQQNSPATEEVQEAGLSLGEFSPELKKIENYYLTAINYELVNLQVTEENKILLDPYFSKLNTLTQEYRKLSEQLVRDKVDEELINSLIDNLQMRLHLMIELKNELKKLKPKENEEHTI